MSALAHDLWELLLPQHAAPMLEIGGGEDQLPSRFRVERLAAGTIGASHMAASALRALQHDAPAEGVALDMRAAAIAFRSERYLRVNGKARAEWAPLSGDYQAGDGRWVRLHCNFPHHAQAALRALGCDDSKEAVSQAVRERSALEVEEGVLAQGGASGAARSRAEWTAHPHFSAVSAGPPIGLERFGDAKPNVPSRVKVLDLTRVIAGPVAGKALAGYGADVIHVASSRLPTIEALDIDHGFGKRRCDVDITTPQGADTLRALVREADVFLESYRPDGLAHHGFGFDDVRKLRPDIVYLSLSAYGDYGPWSGRRGFDSVVQLTSSVAITDPTKKPEPLPCQGLDHATGYLAAFAISAALLRRAREGGAWRARVSLCRTAELLWSLGLSDHLHTPDPAITDVEDLLETAGDVVHVPIPGTIGGSDFRGMPPLTISADGARTGFLPDRS